MRRFVFLADPTEHHEHERTEWRMVASALGGLEACRLQPVYREEADQQAQIIFTGWSCRGLVPLL